MALLCKDWGLERWYTKYLFDQACSSHDKLKQWQKEHESSKRKELTKEENVPSAENHIGGGYEEEQELKLLRASCEDLSGYLENPALVVALLANSSSTNRQLIAGEIERYREQVGKNFGIFSDGDHREGTSMSEADRLKKRMVFQYFTPLNRKMAPFLERYLELSQKLNSTNTLTDQVPDDSLSPPAPISPSDKRKALLEKIDSLDQVQALSRGELELMELDHPQLLLQKLQSLLLPNFEAEVYKKIKYKLKQKEKANMKERKVRRNSLKRKVFPFTPPHGLLLQPSEDLSLVSSAAASSRGTSLSHRNRVGSITLSKSLALSHNPWHTLSPTTVATCHTHTHTTRLIIWP